MGFLNSQVTESNLLGVNNAVSRIRELSIQAGNGAFNNDSDALQDEVAQLQSQITDTFENASFAGKTLFDGQSVSFQIGQDVNTVHSFSQLLIVVLQVLFLASIFRLKMVRGQQLILAIKWVLK